MNKTTVLILCVLLILAILLSAALAVTHQRVRVVEGISGVPIPGATISLERSSGSTEEIGQTDENGEIEFWVKPFPLPKLICVQKTFYPPGCVNAIGFSLKVVELAVP
jgi:hypothetical protein